MKAALLDSLVCPICRAPLTLHQSDARDGVIMAGTLQCSRCARAYPIVDGIPNMLDATLPNMAMKLAEVKGWIEISSKEQWYTPDEQVDLHLPYLVRDLNWTDSVWWATQVSFDRMLASCVRPGMNVLEVGAARCWGGRYWLARGGQYTACDILADPNIGLGRGQFFIDRFGYFERVVADGERLPFHDATFDLAYGIATLHHALDLPRMVGEMARVTKRGGFVIALNEGVRPFNAGPDADIQSDEKQHGINEHVHFLTTYLTAFWRHGLAVYDFGRAIGYEHLIGAKRQRKAQRLLRLPFGKILAAVVILGFGGYDGASFLARKWW